ncbi:Mariner Mos1 transposase [Eumeta japonica]|uniref:Mariner Mos1 transposase n=1 Tax=Eumeta variegata TaxID=151549 RepID=A0A4C1TIM3_EUMVA|nr:Mariner Mos1 transposase [Eumeta japonica]
MREHVVCGFKSFENGDLDVEDKDRSGRPKIYEDAELEEDLSQTQKELALTLEVTQQAVSHRLKSLGIIFYKTLRRSIIICSGLWHMLCQGQRFTSYEDTKNWVKSWISSKDKEFFRLEIRTLPERWKKVVASDEQYFD